jgi:hypothetical protein
MSSNPALLAVALLVASCADEPDSAVRFADPEARAFFIEQLGTEGAQFRIDPDGAVWYSQRDRSLVERAQRLTEQTYYPPYEASATSGEGLSMITSALRERGIKYREIVRSGRTHVTWQESDHAAASAALDDMEQRIRDEAARSACEAPCSSPPRESLRQSR